MDKQLISKLKLNFDEIVHATEDGVEFWYARELQVVLGYTEWRNFTTAIEKAKVACKNSNVAVHECFVDINKTSPMPNGGVKQISDLMLTRYACYLIAQNADPHKEEVAFAQTYFAVQTRRQEIIEQRLSDLNRLQLREQLKTSEKRLSQNIYERGVDERGFGRIRSKGDSALFGGCSTKEMKMRYNIKSGPLADKLPPVTIAAKNLATEMTNLNVEGNDLYGESAITKEHIQNNQSVRSMLGERGIRPEDLPPEEDIKKVKRRLEADEKKMIGQTQKFLPDDETKP